MISDDLNQIRGVVKEEVSTAPKPVNEKLGRVEQRLDTLWD